MDIDELSEIIAGGFPFGELEHVEVDFSQFDDQYLDIQNFINGYELYTYEKENKYCTTLKNAKEEINKEFNSIKEAVQFHFDMKFYLSKKYINS